MNSNLHVLIVEDEVPISQLIQTTLENAGFTTDAAFDGEVAAFERRGFFLFLRFSRLFSRFFFKSARVSGIILAAARRTVDFGAVGRSWRRGK